MHDGASPLCCTAEQQLGLFIALEGGSRSSGSPPAHRGQQWRPLLGAPTDDQQPNPLQTRHTDRLVWRGVVAPFLIGQALCFAGNHRTQTLELLTLRLLPHALLPNRPPLFFRLL